MVNQLILEEVTDPAEIERSQLQFERGRRNMKWLEAHWQQVLPSARGKFIAVAGEEAFVANTPEIAWEMAGRAHPEDNGAFVQYVPLDDLPRIYAYRC